MNAIRRKKLYRKYVTLYEAALRVLAGRSTIKPRYLTEEEERLAEAEGWAGQGLDNRHQAGILVDG